MTAWASSRYFTLETAAHRMNASTSLGSFASDREAARRLVELVTANIRSPSNQVGENDNALQTAPLLTLELR